MKHSCWRPALKAAFPHTIPILTGFLFLGMAYGILMRTQGFHPLFPTVMAITIFGGSLEYVCVEMLLSSFAPLETLMMALLIQARHLFYGLAMLDKYRGFGWKTPLLIFGMCDESFSINCSVDVPKDVDRGWFYLWVTLLNWSYWITGATIGAQLGAVLPFDTEGLDFVMTAMFVVIFLEAWLKEKQHWSSLIGVGCSVGCLLLFGAEGFMLPTMGCILLALAAMRRPIEKAEVGPQLDERQRLPAIAERSLRQGSSLTKAEKEVGSQPDERQRLPAIAERSLRQGSSLTKAEKEGGTLK